MKRYRQIVANPGELRAAWGRDEIPGNAPDLQFAWGGNGAAKGDTICLMEAFHGTGLLKELEARGYDITTLKFSIQRKG